jgi:capsular exopolysaccharide synthesis family protein
MMYETPQSEAPGLEEYLRALRSRWWVVLAAIVVGFVATSLVAGARTPTYEAAAKVTLGPTPVGGSMQQPAQPDPATEADKLKSTAIATAVAEKYEKGTDPNSLLSGLKVSYVSQRNVLDLTYTDERPERARMLANGFASEYVLTREGAVKTYYDSEVTKLTAELSTINTQLAAIERAITEKSNVRNDLQRLPSQSQEQRDQLNVLNNEIDTLNSQRSQLTTRALQLQGQISDAQRARDNRASSADVTRQATLPTTPTGVSDGLLQLAGVLVGLVAGVIIAFTLARLDRSASDAQEVEEATGGPVLAHVPAFRMTKTRGVNALVMVTNSRSLRLQRARESYRRLRTSLQMQLAKTGRNSVLVTSAHPTEGKSVTAANLAIAAAQAGKRTVLVSADLRRPSIERLLSVPNDKGLSDWLAEETEAVVQELPSIPNLSVIVAGNQLDGPGELLASPRLATLVEDLEAEYDLVVLDTPPVLATADAATIVSSVGGALLVVDGRRTDLRVLQLITAELTRAGGHILGSVLNRTKSQPGQSMLRRDAYAYEREARKRLG